LYPKFLLEPLLYLTPPIIHTMAATKGLEGMLKNSKYFEENIEHIIHPRTIGIGIGVAETGIGYLIGQVAGKLF